MSQEKARGPGFNKAPKILDRPLYKDGFWLWAAAAFIFWAAVIWLILG